MGKGKGGTKSNQPKAIGSFGVFAAVNLFRGRLQKLLYLHAMRSSQAQQQRTS